MADGTVSWFVGVDWGSERHQVCLLDAAGQVVGERAFRHSGAGLAALCDWLVSVAGEPSRVAVAIEVPHGPVVDALLDRGFAVHAINPKQLERLRDRVSLAGAKDDRRDARVAAGGLRTDPHLFRPVEAGDPAVIALREGSRLAEELQQERTRLSNRIRQQLWRYYPQLLAVSDDVTAEWVLDWICGRWRPPRPRPYACARRRWPGCFRGTGSAGSMPSRCLASCVSPRSRWLRGSPKPRFCICARWWLACGWRTASSIRPSASWMSSARP